MRRLTASQLAGTIGDVLGVQTRYDIADENLIGFESNISTSLDSTTARTLLDISEEVAAAVVPKLLSDPSCGEQCEQFVVDEVAPRLFRRPLDDETRELFLGLYEQGATQGGTAEGLAWMIQGLLQSPRFVYQLESEGSDGRLDAYSVASRLSLALWGGPPDEAMLDSCESGELATDTGIEAAVERMVDDPRFERGLAQFMAHWMQLERLESATERPDIAALEPSVRHALMNEAVGFLAARIREGAPISEVFRSTSVPTQEALFDIYGDDISSVEGDTVRLDPSRRVGILGLAGVMAALSHAGQTAPTLRGLTVLGNVLCNPPPPPPPGVVTTLPPAPAGATLRERLELHAEDATCAGCHVAMDGIGFAFEGFDWLGQSRTTDSGSVLDTRAEFTFHDGEPVSVSGATEMARVIAGRQDVAKCFARQFSRFAVGVSESRELECALQKLGEAAQSDRGMLGMLSELATSPWFRSVGSPKEAP